MSIYLCICICICISTGFSRVCLLEPLLQIDAEIWRLEHWDIDAEERTVPWYCVGLFYYYDPLCNPMGQFCGQLLYSKWLFITVGATSIDFLKRAYYMHYDDMFFECIMYIMYTLSILCILTYISTYIYTHTHIYRVTYTHTYIYIFPKFPIYLPNFACFNCWQSNFRQWQADPSAVEPTTAYKNADTVFQVSARVGTSRDESGRAVLPRLKYLQSVNSRIIF